MLYFIIFLKYSAMRFRQLGNSAYWSVQPFQQKKRGSKDRMHRPWLVPGDPAAWARLKRLQRLAQQAEPLIKYWTRWRYTVTCLNLFPSFLSIIFFFLIANTWGKFSSPLPRGCKARRPNKARSWKAQGLAACKKWNFPLCLPPPHTSQAFMK